MSTRTTLILVDWHEAILISRVAIDHIQQWFTPLEASEVLAEQIDDLVPVIRPDAGRMWRDDDVGQAPERACPIKRFVFENVQHGAAEMAVLNGCNESRLVHDLSTRNINNDGPRIEQRDFLRTDEAIGSGD